MADMLSNGFSVRRLVAVLAVAIAGAALPGGVVPPASAQTLNPYKVTGIQVAASARTAAAAKSKAIEKGWERAVTILLRRITLRKDRERLPEVAPGQLATLKDGFEIETERSAPTSYSGRVTYRFRAAEVGRLLKDAEVTYVETPSKPVLIVAVYKTASAETLWDEPNPWRNAWSRLDWRNGLVDFTVPRGDLGDLRAIDAKQAAAADKAALAKLATIYNAGEVLLTIARADGKAVRITVQRFSVIAGTFKPFRSYAARTPDAKSLGRVARAIAAAYEESWKARNMVATGGKTTMTVVVPILDLTYWIKVRKALGTVRALRGRRVLQLNREEARVEITYVGNVEQLQTALAQSDLVLAKVRPDAEGQDTWILKMAGTVLPERYRRAVDGDKDKAADKKPDKE